ncbi:GLEYA domain-containing protein [Flavitalea antarctica]
MKKIYILLVLIAYLSVPSMLHAQNPVYVGKVADVSGTFKKRAEAAKKLTTAETIVALPRLGNQQLALKVNASKQEKDGEFFFGEVNNVKESKFYIRIQGSVAEGGIIMPAQKKFYRYSSTSDGSIYLKEEDIDKVFCIGKERFPKIGAEGAPGITPAAAAAPPGLQSLPGATAVLYLDFDGQTVENTVWNRWYNNGNPIVAAHAVLSETEMIEVWKLMSEDFRPFNLNVTTDEGVFNNAPVNLRQRIIFTPTNYFLPGWGGYAYIGSFRSGGSPDGETPCWVWNPSVKGAGEAGSHEAGHTLGLGHDGRTTPPETYFAGQNNWGPIMGTTYTVMQAQWSKGEYPFANNQEDDLNIMTGYGFGFRNDDHGNDPATATPLVIDAAGNASSTDNRGVITTRGDVDVFSYVSPGGNVEFRIDPEINYANLDVFLSVRNSAGATIATIDQATVFIAQTLNLPAGTYYLSVDGTMGELGANSDYGSLGAYYISATATSNNCASLGYITSEFWQNVPGENISSIPLTTSPTFTSQLTSFETPSNITNGYGQRVRGYICAPVTGNYTFFIAADNIGELWLSTNDNPASKRRIAYSPDWVAQREWTRYAEQRSVSISLQANTKYYIEALDVEGGGGDNLAVGWTTPGSSAITVIPGSVLSPYTTITNQPPAVGMTTDATNYTEPATIRMGATANDPDGSVTKVEFFWGSLKIGEDISAPYEFSWEDVGAGTFTFTAKATDNSGNSNVSDPVTVMVSQPTNTCSSAGYIVREFWQNVAGERISSIPLHSIPTFTSQLTSFEAPSNITNGYGQRVRGYVCAPVTGNYTFYIAADNVGELWLSTNDNPANKLKIAHSPDWVGQREWTRYAEQKSVSINLQANTKYYIEALHVEGGGGDNLAVGWITPGSSDISVIPGTVLSPFTSITNQPPTVKLIVDGNNFLAPANFTVTAIADDGDGSITKVEFFLDNVKTLEIDRAPYEIRWTHVSAGRYSLTAKATDNSGNSTTSDPVVIEVLENTGTCSSPGYIVREFWQNVAGEKISAIPLNSAPTTTSQLTSFEAPSNITNGYGQRVRGYICAPFSGNYTFYIAADNVGELWLSTSDNPALKQRIAHSPDWVGPRDWTRYAEQKSVQITLQANTRYYIEALHVEGGGGDNLAVGWTTPGNVTIDVIPGSVLSPFSEGAASTASKINPVSADDLSVKVFPNPGVREFTLLIKSAKNEVVNMKVFDAVGRIVESRSNVFTNSAVKFGSGYRPGVYFAEIIRGGKRTTVKLIKVGN